MNNQKDIIVFLNLPLSASYSYKNKGSFYPSTALIYIGSLLKERGYEVKIIDGCYHEDYLNILSDFLKTHQSRIVFLGMSVMTPQVPVALYASQVIKDISKDFVVVWGGPHPTLFPEQTVKNDFIDIVAINEGAITALNLANALSKNEDITKIKGIAFKINNNLKVNKPASLEKIQDLPHLDFSLIDINNYLETNLSVYQREFPHFKDRVRPVLIVTGLGCPYKCQFCINVILKRQYRIRPAESIIEEIKYLIKKYQTNTFIFMDEDFFVNKERVLKLIDLIEKENIHFNWRMWCRVDHFKENYINKELLNRLARIGFGSMVMGGESGNQEILNALKKGITTKQIVHSLKELEGLPITPRYSFMVGLENETIEQIKNTYKFCFRLKEIRKDVDIAGPFTFRLYPGSPIFNRLVERYKLKIPQTVNDWGEYLEQFDSNYSPMPWTPEKFQKDIKYINFYGNLAMKINNSKSKIKYIILMTLYSIAKFRIKHFFFHVPFEYYLVEYIRKTKS